MTAVIADRSAVIVGEAHHRFCNSLQLIVAATNGILRSGGCDHDARDRLMALQERITSLAEVNRCLSGPVGPESLSRQALERLCACLITSFDRPDTGVWISVTGQMVDRERHRPLLLLISELVTNALKHGASNQQLLIGIELTVTFDRCLLLVRSNMTGRRCEVRPRIATELAETAGGTLQIMTCECEFAVAVVLPNESRPI